MIAEITPEIGGAPDVIAIPIENGSDTIATMNPDRRSQGPVFQTGQDHYEAFP